MANDGGLFNEVPEHLRISSSDLHIGELIGYGSSSEVRRATWLGCEVAVKELIIDELHNAYPKELEILTRLPHPHVVQLLGFILEAEQRRAAIVMELLETNLAIVMNDRMEAFDFYEAIDIATKIALGMRFLHSREVVHGSLTPDIILMNVHTEGQLDIKIGGFAFSDQARNSGKAADVRHFAWICYTILTGCSNQWLSNAIPNRFSCLWLSSDGELEREEIIAGMAAMELPAGISDDLAELILKCGDDDPENRPGFPAICERLADIRARCDQALKKTTVTEDRAFQWTTHADDEGNKCLEIANMLETLPIHLSIDPADVEWRRPIGTGGYNEVCEVNWLGCSFAVKRFKFLSPSFKDEVTFLTKLQHPHIARLIGVSVDDNGGWIMMERMDMDLRELINSRAQGPTSSPPFSGIEAQELCLKIALGLNFLHSKDVVHRDIKAANVLVHDHHGRFDVKITDFGASHRMGNPNHVAHRAGTSLWRAPEVLRANRGELKEEQLKKTDVYSFAMTCYEILTGNAPHEHLKVRDVLAKRRPKLPAALHPELTILISKCWDDDPELPRYEVNWLGCSCAVKRFKFLSPSFKDEVTFLTKLQHPHIARLIGVSVDDNGGWIMMERMDMDLHKLINSCAQGPTSSPPFSGIEAQELCLKIALGLNFLHSKDVVHKDIKAANVLVHNHHGRFDMKITDFGSTPFGNVVLPCSRVEACINP